MIRDEWDELRRTVTDLAAKCGATDLPNLRLYNEEAGKFSVRPSPGDDRELSVREYEAEELFKLRAARVKRSSAETRQAEM